MGKSAKGRPSNAPPLISIRLFSTWIGSPWARLQARAVFTLRRKGLVARTLTVKLRFADLSYQTRSFTMERPTDTAGVLYPECVRQLKVMLGLPASAESATPLPKTIRLAGMSTSSLSKAAATAVQPSLDDMLEEADNARGQTSQARLHDAEAALDAVRRKFGNKA